MSTRGYINNKHSNKPTVIVPDIHARLDFVDKIFEKYPRDIWDIVFLGDIIHSENRHRWIDIEWEYKANNFKFFGESMYEEIYASLSCVATIVTEQEKTPESVFVVRGNHDDLKGSFVGTYGKYTRLGESSLFANGLKDHNPGQFADYARYEKTIPYLYLGRNFMCSHTVPANQFYLDDVKLDEYTTHLNFTWTDNVSQQGKWTKNFSQNIHKLFEGDPLKYWFIGHRPCDHNKLVRKQMGGKLIQINHPTRWVVIELLPDDNFNAVELSSL